MKKATGILGYVLSYSILIAGCRPVDVSIHPAVVQGACPPMQVVPAGVSQESGPSSCQVAKEVKSLIEGIAQVVAPTPPVQVAQEVDSKPKAKVIDRVVVKRGYGLIAATRRTMLPLSLTESLAVGKKYNRHIRRYISAQGVVTVDVRMSVGEELFLVQEADKKYWVMERLPKKE